MFSFLLGLLLLLLLAGNTVATVSSEIMLLKICWHAKYESIEIQQHSQSKSDGNILHTLTGWKKRAKIGKTEWSAQAPKMHWNNDFLHKSSRWANNRFGGECHDNGLYVLKINMNIECNLILLMSLGSPIQNTTRIKKWRRQAGGSHRTSYLLLLPFYVQ